MFKKMLISPECPLKSIQSDVSAQIGALISEIYINLENKKREGAANFTFFGITIVLKYIIEKAST